MVAKIQAIADDLKRKAEENGTTLTNEEIADILEQAKGKYFASFGQDAVVETYETDLKGETKFLWIKNIWVTDASYKHPVLGYGDFSNEIIERKSCSCSQDTSVRKIQAYTEDGYKLITEKMGEQKSQANGYFILIALSIGTILLQQFLSMRSQKEQQKYSSVDGQGAGNQKMMMVMMTGMFAIFSFMYSSAFSTYLIVSNVFSMLSMFIINKIVDSKENKKQEAIVVERSQSYNAKRIEAAKEAGKKAAQEKRGIVDDKSKKKK
jgi:membrane protein insertase Oxa1/YidC/SpoIIIJ